ncbi:MAG: tol-pal system protein YbgF, partial [Xanthomonadaceae bacterium]|nr:tol-pal system protein YbgF [Xanthomonadaceae bacterium]
QEAVRGFSQFLTTFPDSPLADNAQYWLGESHYVTRQFSEALRHFQAVVDKYPDSRKIPDALLKIGYCNYELKNYPAARSALGQVVSRFGDTTAARLAAQRLTKMESEGR